MFHRISTLTKFLAALSFLLGMQPAIAQTANQVTQTPPVQLGTSGGNIHDASRRFCCSGTLGSLVTKGGVQYILSNNHVLADADAATVGDAISQPGLPTHPGTRTRQPTNCGTQGGISWPGRTVGQKVMLSAGNSLR